MHKRVSVGLRLVIMLAMALGLATLLASPAAAQTQTVQCQTIIDGQINQDDCEVTVTGDGQCQVVLPDGEILQNIGCSPEGCPQQAIDEDGNIYQFQCDGVAATNTPVPPTATTVPATDVPATATHVPATTAPGTSVPATDVPATDVPDEEVPVDNLPDTGQGSSIGQSSTATVLLLGAMGMVLALGAVALRMRGNR